MKVLLVLCGLILAALADPYVLHGGYKTSSKYIYHYEGRIRPAQVPLLKDQFIELYLNATVELHPISNEKFVLKISKHKFKAKISDPKYTDGPITWKERFGDIEDFEDDIEEPVIFIYSNGIVRNILMDKDDEDYSINLKKGLISLFNVDIQGKDPETKRDDLFTKPEMSVIGVCQTSYSIQDLNVTNAKRQWTRMGYNITKVIDMNNCTSSDYEVNNKVVPGPNENKDSNPLQSSATIKYNIIGEKNSFKIEEVHAVGMHVLYLIGKEEGGINSVTDQRLKLIKTEDKSMKKQDIAKLGKETKPEKLMMNVRSFGNLEYVPDLSDRDENNIVEYVHSSLVKLLKLLPSSGKTPKLDPRSSKGSTLPEVSDIILRTVEALRKADDSTFTKVWTKCSTDPKMKKWILYLISLCETQNSMDFMEDNLKTLPEELIADYLFSVGFHGKPSKKMAEIYLKEITEIDKIKKSPYLTKLVYLAASGMVKTYCKQKKIKTLWFDTVLAQLLKKIPTLCIKERDLCKPHPHLPATVVLAFAENVERPMLFPHLDRIVFTEALPLEIRVKALLAIRPLVRIIPNKVHVTMLRVFRDRTYDTELRTIAFAVIMDNPSPQIVLHIARTIRTEPSLSVRRFIYDKFVSIRHTKVPYSPKIVSVVKIALQLYSKSMLPSHLLSKTNNFHLNWFSKNWTIGATLQHEEIYKTSFLPNLITSHLNVTIFGRNISVLEGQLRFEGLQDYLKKLVGPSGYLEKKHSVFDFLRSKRAVSDVVKTFNDLKEKFPIFAVPEKKLKIFSQLKMFGKIFHVNETTVDSNADLKSLIMTGSILRAAKLESDLKKGTTYEFSKPYMPVEVIYRMPSLIGITMTANLTSIVLPVSFTKFKAEVKPGLFTPKSLLWKQRDSLHVSAEHSLNAIADIRGRIDFRIPSIVVGGKVRTFVNVSTHLKAEIDYNFKTRQFKTEIETPKQIREILLIKRNASHFLKSEFARPDLHSSDRHETDDSTSEPSPTKSGPGELESTELRPTGSGPKESESTESHSKDLRSTELRPTKSRPSVEKTKVPKLKKSAGLISESEWNEYLKTYGQDGDGDDDEEHLESSADGDGSEEDQSQGSDEARRRYFGELRRRSGMGWRRRKFASSDRRRKYEKYGRKYERLGRKYAEMGMKFEKNYVGGYPGRFRRSDDRIKEVDRETISLTDVSPAFSTADHHSTTTSSSSVSTSTWSTSSATTTESSSTPTPTLGGEGSSTSTSITETPSTGSTPTATKTSTIRIDATASPTRPPYRPTGPQPTGSKPGPKPRPSVRRGKPRYIQIPIEIDQLGKMEVFGLNKRPDINEGWTLKVNGQFLSATGGKVVLSGTPTIWNVTFHGRHHRVVSFRAPDKSFIATTEGGDCLTLIKKPKKAQKLFVLTKTRPGTIKIKSVVSMGKKPVPKSWKQALLDELEEIMDVERIFHEEMVEMENKEEIQEEKMKPELQKARLAHWIVKGNSICLSPREKDSVRIKFEKKQTLNEVLRKQSFEKGECMHSSYGLQTCLHGYRPYPRLNHLPLLYSPMEYRLLLKPSTKNKPQKFEFSMKFPEPDAKSKTWVATVSVNPSTKITVTVKYDYSKGTARLEVLPSRKELTKFPKFCLGISLLPDNVNIAASFARNCVFKNLKVDILTTKDLPRFWMALRMKYNSKLVPDYITDTLGYISENVIIPTLKSTAFVYPRPNPNKKYEKMIKLKLELPTNDTARLVLKTRNLTYMMDDIKLPNVLKTLPKGSKEVSLVKKLTRVLLKPRCLHINNTFVTFDKKSYNFTLRGHCEHQLLRICDKNSTNIAVLTRKLDKRLRRVVTVFVDSHKIEIMPTSVLHGKPKVTMDNRPVDVKQLHEVMDKDKKKPLITIIWEPTSKTMNVEHHKYGLHVTLRESHIVSLSVSPFFTNKTCGLCGNSDGEDYNDFMTPEGFLVNDVIRPTLFYPQVRNSSERIFASSWVTPGKSCNKDCPFERTLLKLKPKEAHGKTCISNHHILQCAQRCKESTKPEITRVPMTCVPDSVIPQLKQYLTKGGKVDLSQAEGYLAEISIPRECKCAC